MARTAHRITLISDLHGNAIALRQVLSAIDEQGTDEIVCLGDVANLGVAPCEVVDRVQALGCRCVMGNHDDYLLDPELIDGHNEDPMLQEATDWCRDQLSTGQLELIRGYESMIELPLGPSQRVMLFHGSPSSNTVNLLAHAPPDVFDEQLGSERATVMVGGHTHVQMLRRHCGTLVVNAGSVGAPFLDVPNGEMPMILPYAEYATVDAKADGDVAVTLHRLALDRGELANAASASSNPMGAALAAFYR